MFSISISYGCERPAISGVREGHNQQQRKNKKKKDWKMKLNHDNSNFLCDLQEYLRPDKCMVLF